LKKKNWYKNLSAIQPIKANPVAGIATVKGFGDLPNKWLIVKEIKHNAGINIKANRIHL
jgi:hypothetical protein